MTTLPIITCDRSGIVSDVPQWRFWCPHCRRHHHHGGMPDSNGVIGHRIAHCTALANRNGYILREERQ